MPNVQTFPFASIKVTPPPGVALPVRMSPRRTAFCSSVHAIDMAPPYAPSSALFTCAQATLKDGSEFTLDGAELNRALQYSPTPGMPALLKHVQQLQRWEHGQAQPQPSRVCITTGSE